VVTESTEGSNQVSTVTQYSNEVVVGLGLVARSGLVLAEISFTLIGW
jgi:hypothetical protein